jgi:hypothetical protein
MRHRDIALVVVVILLSDARIFDVIKINIINQTI